MLYSQLADHLSAISITLDNESQMFGLALGFNIRAPGTHQVFPYNLGGSNFSTSSTETPSVGVLQYSGFLLSETDIIRDKVFGKIGDIQSSARLKIVDQVAGQTLFHATLWGFRIGGVGFTSSIMGNSTIISGQFENTFRSLTVLPF